MTSVCGVVGSLIAVGPLLHDAPCSGQPAGPDELVRRSGASGTKRAEPRARRAAKRRTAGYVLGRQMRRLTTLVSAARLQQPRTSVTATTISTCPSLIWTASKVSPSWRR